MNSDVDSVPDPSQSAGMLQINPVQQPTKEQELSMREKVRAMKARGKTYQQIADELGFTKQVAHYYGKASPGEHICPRCNRPFKQTRNFATEVNRGIEP